MTKIPFSRAAHAISFSSQNSNSKLMSRRIQNSGEERDVRGMNISFPYLQLHCTAPACIQRGYGEIARCLYAVLAFAHGSFEIARQRAALDGGPVAQLSSRQLQCWTAILFHGRVRVTGSGSVSNVSSLL